MDDSNIVTKNPRLEIAGADDFDFQHIEEALTVLAFNDVCARVGSGKFFYLPEPVSSLTPLEHKPTPDHMHLQSVVPCLLFVQYSWDLQEKETYLKGNASERWRNVQGLLSLDPPERRAASFCVRISRN